MDESRLRAARVTSLFAAAKPAYFAEPASAGIVVAVLWGPNSAGSLLAWFALLLVLTLARLALHWRFMRAPVAPVHAPAWKRRFALAALASGTAWALAVFVLFPDHDPLRQMALVFVAGAHLIAAAGLYGASRTVFYAFGAFPFLAILIRLLGQPGEVYRLMALVVAVFGVVMWKVHLDTHRSVLANLRGQLANEDLLARLETTEEKLRDAIAGSALKASEAMYRNLVETSSELIWSLDLEGRWTYLNAAGARRIYRREANEMLGRAQSEVVARELRERDEAVLQRVLAGEAVFEHETRHLRADGSPVDLSFNAIAQRDLEGNVVGATGTARDITERKRAAAALHESVEKLRLAVRAADLRYWEWDAGRDGPGLPAATGGELVHADDRERCARAWNEAVAAGEPYEVEYRVPSADGESVWFSSRGVPVLDAAGRAYRMIGVSQDITARKRREEAVRFLAYHDSLTGLPNRRLLDDRLKQALYSAQRRDRKWPRC